MYDRVIHWRWQHHYQDGIDLYYDENYSAVVEKMERSLAEFYSEADECRLLCENSFDHEEFPAFYNAIAGTHQ